MRTSLLCFSIVFLLLFPGLLVGQGTSPLSSEALPGELDPSFGTNGQVVTNIGGTSESGRAIFALPDGKIVVVGINANNSSGPEHDDFAVVRYNADGALDTSFGANGIVTTDFGNGRGELVLAAAMQPDGKVIAVGVGEADDADFAVARYNTDGSLDATFGNGGLLLTDVSEDYDQAESVVVQPDGKIVVGGTVGGGPSRFGLVRYSADGALDTSFGTDGRVLSDAGSDPRLLKILLQPDGKIVAVGNNYPNGFTEPDPLVARYNPDGSLDASFGNGGVVTKVTSAFEFIQDAVLQPDGNIVVAGFSRPAPGPGSNAALLQRYLSDGSPDSNFGSAGTATHDVGANMIYITFALQPDGKLVLGGASFENGYALVRANANGTIDSDFGDNGVLLTPGNGEISDIVLQEDGKLLATGYSMKDAPPDFSDMVTMRFDLGAVEVATEDPFVLPQNVIVASNYPNPFSTQTNIRFSLPRPGTVTLKVFDLLGREVATLLDAPQQAGTTEAVFVPGELSAGIYLYQIRIDGALVGARRMVFMR